MYQKKPQALTAGQLLGLRDIPEVLREIREDRGLSKAHLADDLGVTERSVMQAETQPHRALFKLRKRMLERFTGYTLDGPYYRVKPKQAR